MSTHYLQIPCSVMPFVCESDYSVDVIPKQHVDRTAPFHVAIYLLKGWMEIIEDGTAYELVPNRLFFLKAGVHHWGEQPFEAGSAWYYAHFYCAEPENTAREFETLGNFGLSEESALQGKRIYAQRVDEMSYLTLPKLMDCEKGGRIEREFEKLVTSHRAGNVPVTSIHLLNIFAESARLRQDSEPDNAYVRSMAEFIRNNYVRNFTAAEIERVCGLSYKYAGTLFKEVTGRTIKEYQYMLRLDLAEKYLRETDVQIGEIAQRTGFSDVFYFSRIFHRERGCTPSQYRKSYIPGI